MSYEEYYKKQIDNFQRYGEYTYVFDEVGNVVFNSSSGDFSQVFLGLPLQNYVYDNTKIVSFYDPTFTEFIPQTTTGITEEQIQDMQNELEAQKIQTDELTNQLEALIAANESNPTAAEKEATKRVILELRKALGEGRVDSDFSEDFPYTSLIKPSSIATAAMTSATSTSTETANSVATTSSVDVASVATRPESTTATAQASASVAALTTALKSTLTQWVDDRRQYYQNRSGFDNRSGEK